jgi:DNA-binding beta-propeller fold protein YncE
MTPFRSVSFTARALLFAGAAFGTSLASVPAAASQSFTAFESGQVRPLALSQDGKLLFAVNTPDNRLEIFRVKDGGLVHKGSIPVGLEPVSVAVRTNGEVWVVNHLSDSVSIVSVDSDGDEGRVVRTLLVGDEPRDIVFAGPGRERAFITTAHRGQNSPIDPQLTTPGVGRSDVWVFAANNLGASLGGNPLTIVTLFSDTPRALATSPDGKRVYAAAFHSGNRTTTITETVVTSHGGLPPVVGAPPGAPTTGLIVKQQNGHWQDELGRNWDAHINFSLPDKDVFTIDATGATPHEIAGGFYTGVGTVLYNMAVNPVSGKVYVSNTESRNENRFEGPGILAGHTVRGHVVENRISILGNAGSVTARHLNKHINYAVAGAPLPNAENAKSLAMPTGMVVSSDGSTIYVAALGSSKIGTFSTSALEQNTFVPSVASQIAVSGGGPTGLALDEARHRLYVLTRFDNSISIVNTQTKTETAHVGMHNPEPASVTVGRRFLYDAAFTSSHGDQACASCHIFGDMDDLAWDLGNPDEVQAINANPFAVPAPPVNPITGVPFDPNFHPMKGPMTTQSLRGMANHGPMHWRGDRTGGLDSPAAPLDEDAAFKKFNVAFNGLLGRSGPISDGDMQAFTDFALQMTYPPNPIRALDNSLTPEQQAGFDLFTGARKLDGQSSCNGCHADDRNANPGSAIPGFFGTSGLSSFDFESQAFKVPHLRNLYEKVGMFGAADAATFNPVTNPGGILLPGYLGGNTGDQIRGFGFLHDGSIDTMFRFHDTVFFAASPGNPEGFPSTPAGQEEIRALEAFLFAFDSNMAPIVGQQVTLAGGNAGVVAPRVTLLQARADAGECDLVAKTELFHQETGFLYVGNGEFLGDRAGWPKITDAMLRGLAAFPRHEVTYTCVPRGSGARLALDRDDDGFLDGDELDACSDPADPTSTP